MRFLLVFSIFLTLIGCSESNSQKKLKEKNKSHEVLKKKDQNTESKLTTISGKINSGTIKKTIRIKRNQIRNKKNAGSKFAYRFGKINNINFDKFSKNKSNIVIKEDTLTFSNTWAYDLLSNADGAGALIQIDNNFYKINYGVKRTDVRKYSKSENVGFCGIKGQIDISKLQKGKHSIAMLLLGTNRNYYYKSKSIDFIKN